MNLKAIVVVALLLSASSLLGHTPEERKADLEKELTSHFDPAWVKNIFNHQDMCAGREIPTEIIKGGWPELEARVMSEPSVLRGELFFRSNETTLRKAADRFGFSAGSLGPFVLTAILRTESDFGDSLTGTPVVRTLFAKYHRVIDGPQGNVRRADIFKKEILPFFKAAEENSWDVCEVLGSRAAAFGYTQFIPGSLYLTVDGDGDGKVDIQNNLADAVHSAAHHLHKRGGQTSLRSALLRYNNSSSYVRIITRYAQAIQKRVETSSPATTK